MRSGRWCCSSMIRPGGSRELGKKRGTREGGRGMISQLLLALAIAPVPSPASPFPQDTSAGKIVYVKWRAGCHGVDGKGEGEGAPHMIPPPRDFTTGLYQLRLTARGELLADA